MDYTTAAVLYCFVLAGVFLGLWLYYDRRDHARFERERRRSSFHCIKCDKVYAPQGRPELCVCPACGHENARLSF